MEVQAAGVHPAIWAVGLWFLIVTLSGWIVTRPRPHDVTLRSRPAEPPGRLGLATEGLREWVWRRLGRALHLVAAHLSGRRASWVQRRSLRCTRRAAALEMRRRRRAIAAAHREARDRAWDRIRGSSPSSPWTQRLPPSAPRPVLPEEAEETRRWERTLPWGTPSPLLTREWIGKPYPFVPLAEPPPNSAPGTVYRSPPRRERPKPPLPPPAPRKVSM